MRKDEPARADRVVDLQGRGERRRVSPLLAAGIVLMPVVFVWRLFRPGYSGTVRLLACAYAALAVVWAAAWVMGGPPG